MKTKYLVAKKSSIDVEFMWIDKYKPMCKEEMLGNNELIKDLKNWLDPSKKKSKKSKVFTVSSDFQICIVHDCNFYCTLYISIHFLGKKYDDEDFIFDTESNKAQHNLAILLGPSGCGKTSAVYAVANELNANVMQ